MRIAVLADIHGNLAALEAVLADLRGESPDLVVNLGDCLSGPLAAGATADRLISENWLTVRGNHDRVLLTGDRAAMGSWDGPAFDDLAPRHFDWLRGLPETAAVDEVLLCHGSPASDTTYLLETPRADGPALRPPADIVADLAGVTAKVVLCGHSHTPRAVWLADGRLVVNPGAVGIQAYRDDHPCDHLMETGSPHARYALVERGPSGWTASFRLVAYDWDDAAQRAAAAGAADWVGPLRTGRAPA
ncbi:metallophosphoesterase family protein [Methylobrevis albus]|uniref:Metallophosphoesterase family protein n=1 Tax=Methylobrevis albus TaxID=2793297 RepID=A0A931I012_9HYPH|nr:metallophosphoesterase family protein [Methylobrevis albus]MBH0236914.1 metallophosphoesterase family protein [Methylobrevis albus]